MRERGRPHRRRRRRRSRTTATAPRSRLPRRCAHVYDRATDARQRQRRARHPRRDGERDPRQRRRRAARPALRAKQRRSPTSARATPSGRHADTRACASTTALGARCRRLFGRGAERPRLRLRRSTTTRTHRAVRRRRRGRAPAERATTTCARPTARASASAGNVARRAADHAARPPARRDAVRPTRAATGGEDPESLDDARAQRAADRADPRPRGVAAGLRGLRARLRRHRQGARAVDPGRPGARRLPHRRRSDGAAVAGRRATLPRTCRPRCARTATRSLPLAVQTYRAATFRLRATVKVAADADADDRAAGVEARLRAAFAFDARDFGQGVSLDEVSGGHPGRRRAS